MSAARRVLAVLEHPDVKFGMWASAGTLAILIFVGFIFPAPPSILFLGAVLGSLNALMAMGLVLIYRANRIINFAQGDLGAVAAVLAVSLIVGPRWPFFLAMLTGLVAALALGALVEFTIIRRFARSPRLILSVATIALSAVLAGVQLVIPRFFGYDVAPQNFPIPFRFSFEWFPVVYTSSHLMVLVAVPLAAAGLGAFFRYSRAGVAVRAAAESSDRAALLGIPVKRIGTLVWVLAAGLSAVAVLLRAPIVGVSIGSVLGPSILLKALAAAVLARMERLPIAFVAGLLLGVLENSIFWATGRTLVSDAGLFFVIIAALLLQRRGSVSRADDREASSWSATREIRPIPRELMALPLVRNGARAIQVVVLAVVVLWPMTQNGSRVNLLGVGLIFGMIGISLVVLTGWAGQISLGHLAFVAFGGAVAGRMSQNGWHFFVCVIAAGVAGAVAAVVIGIPAVRIRGPFLAVTTLAFALATGSFFLNPEFFPWLVPDGRVLRPVLFGKFDLESEHTYYVLLVIVLLVVMASARSLRRSRTGRVLLAMRDNPRAAQSYGVSPVRARLTAFAYSGFVAAIAGSMYVFHQHALSTTILRPEESIRAFQMVVIGGLGSIPGGLLGAAFETFLRYSPFTKVPASRLLGSGLGVLVILLFLPGGLGGLLYDARDNLLRRIARAKGVVVPSLLADVRVDEGASADDEAMALNLEGMQAGVDLELLEAR
ncbi:MAG TPA: ABC transporter permease [Acidimicrobiales bacterium]|nr:ABC transporter permease [Acidimicrobiales bacterium]